MLDVEFYRLYNGLWACDLMPRLCRVFAVIFAIFTKVCRVFAIFCRAFLVLLSLPISYGACMTPEPVVNALATAVV